jgi:hypothetical protein
VSCASWTKQDGKRHGEGTYTYSTMMGGVYTGQWRNGMRDGWGKLVKNDGEMYQVRRHAPSCSHMTTYMMI